MFVTRRGIDKMPADSIEPGDIVIQKHYGTDRMVVVQLLTNDEGDRCAECEWVNDSGEHKGIFLVSRLEKTKPDLVPDVMTEPDS
jgi:hypothetical protein